jgi:glycosyltransferase 2 family protein
MKPRTRSVGSWRRAAAGVAAGAVVSAIFTYFAVRSIDFDAFREGLSECNYWWLLPAAGLMALGVALRALRWQLLFPRGVRPPFGPTTRALLIGQFFNSIFPARAGEAARVIVLHRETNTSRAQAAGTAVVERIYDVTGLLMLLFVFLPLLPELPWLRRAAVFAAIVGAVVAVGIVILVLFGERAVRLVLWPLRRVPRVADDHVDDISVRLAMGLWALHRPSLALPAFVLTIGSWLIFAASFWAVAIGFDLAIGYAGGMLVLVATSLVLVIPSLPGAIGTFEAAVLVALRAYDVEDSEALAYAVVLHALNLFPFIVLGYLLLHGHIRRPVPGAAD